MQRGLPIVPVRIEDVRPTGALEYFLASVHWLDAFPEPLQPKLDRLADAVSSLIGPKPQPAGVEAAGAPPVASAEPRLQRKSWLQRLFGRSEPAQDDLDRAVAAQIADELGVSRLEELAKFAVSRPLRRVFAAISPDLPERLDRIARQTEQILVLRSPGRQLETTEAALRSLAEIRSELLDHPGLISDAAIKSTTMWANLLKEAGETARKKVDDARELENPFIFGNPVQRFAEGLFTGRRDLVLQIERSIVGAKQTPTLLLYGQRRMGKTSILNQLPSLLGPGFLPVTIDCQAPAAAESQASLLRYVSYCMSSALNLQFKARPDGGGNPAVSPLTIEALRSDGYSVFEDWLDAFQKRLPDDSHVLLCFDEFERLKQAIAAGWGTSFLDGLRHWAQHRPRFALMFIGSHTFEQLGSTWTDRFLSARRLKVSFLSAEDVRKLLTEPMPGFRLTYAPGALEAVLELTHGQPFLTQALASELVDHLNRAQRKSATPSDVEAAVVEALDRSGEYFADLWLSRTDDEREVLRAVAQGKPQPPVNPIARALRDYDILDDRGDFAVPLVKRWVQHNQLQPSLPS